jgi:serine protease Do
MLTDLQATIAAVADRVGPSVVGLGRGWAAGSGVVIAPNRVLTVAHALRGDDATVTLPPDGRRVEGRILGAAAEQDLAVLEVDTGDAPAIEYARGDEPPGVGTPVLALADPGGRGLRVTLGFVTTDHRSVRGPRGRRIAGAIEHSAPLPRGSSGGPLVDADGRLLALNATRREGGLILALPAPAEVVDRLSGGEGVEPRRLGVALAPPRVARRLRVAVGLPERDGLLVRGVAEGSPAEAAGVQRGDLIVAAAGTPVTSFDTLHAAIDAAGDDPIALTLLRGVDEIEANIA